MTIEELSCTFDGIGFSSKQIQQGPSLVSRLYAAFVCSTNRMTRIR